MEKLCCILLLAIIMISAVYSSPLHDYVNTPDDTFSWSIKNEVSTRLITRTDIEIVSQTWQGIAWTHHMIIFRPQNCGNEDTAVLFITGNYRETSKEILLGSQIALRSKCMVAVLYDIPNQPLYDGKNEDALIAYTLLKYLETKDKTWPLHFPMTKAAIRAMDAIQEIAKNKSLPNIDKFVVTGASKRGWTTWLAAASDQKRIKGIMPMVYDNLDLKAQMKRQVISFGDYSEQINDYTEHGLQDILAGKTNDPISAAVDPWTYRNILKMPKLIINGTNDPYWPQDALNLYWNGLKGPKSVLYMANSGHGLVNNDDTGAKLEMLLKSMSIFARSIAEDKLLPHINWKHSTSGNTHKLSIVADPESYAAKMWIAKSSTRDFRQSVWESVEMTKTSDGFIGKVDLPVDGFMAVFGEASSKIYGSAFTESTQIRILNNKGAVN